MRFNHLHRIVTPNSAKTKGKNMNMRKFFNIVISIMVIASTLFGTSTLGKAMPGSPTDQTKVPHYFGPYPNWSNSPFTLPDVTVEITGDGSGATAVASVGNTGDITGITVTNPGVGYTSANVVINSTSGSGATASAVVTASGSVTSISVGASGAGYTSPSVTISGGGGSGTLVNIGNPLSARAFATDYATAPGVLAPVFVVLPASMPAAGIVQSIQYFNQATAGASPTPSAGNLFHAYVLHATGVANEYSVLWDSGELTVPAAVDPVGDIVTLPVPGIAVTTGDTIAFYGQGIPLDDQGGVDILSTPAPLVPAQGNTITLGGVDYPIYSQNRTYSFAASVLDTSAVAPLVDATATAYGGVDAVALGSGGSGYTMPTVDFDLPDGPDGVQAQAHANFDPATGAITAVVVDQPGSGYSFPPKVVIRDGTLFDPINNGGSGATATATLKILSVTLDTFGAGYTSAPSVVINDPTGTGASATASVNAGGVTSITVGAPGTGYITKAGIKKFQDGLPVLCNPTAGWANCKDNNLGQHIPIAVPDTTTFPGARLLRDRRRPAP